MFKKIKRIILSVSLAGLLLAPALVPAAVASAQSSTPTTTDCTSTSGSVQGCLGAGACLNTTDPNCDADTGGDANTRVNNIIKLVINMFSLVVGVISVIMIIVGGLKYITSSGDSGNVTGAKNTILYAIIGLVVVALAQVIVRFVLAKVTQ